jgi:hypothetical protein
MVEYKGRRDEKARELPLDDIVATLRGMIGMFL